MSETINTNTGRIVSVYAVEGDRLLVESGGAFHRVNKRDYAPGDCMSGKDNGPDAVFNRRISMDFSLSDLLSRLRSGELDMNVGESFTTRMKNGMEVDFVCTDKDEQSYRFESRDCLGRYGPMTKIDRFYDDAWAELPDALKDNIMEIVRRYEAPDGKLMERTCKLFLPSAAEIFPPDECYGDQGLYAQLAWYKDPHNRIRAYEKGGGADWYWTQTAHSGRATYFCTVLDNGKAYSNNASTTRIAAPVCFRIRRFSNLRP